MKGIILAGGSGSRLLPMTTYVNKHLLPVYDKPMIYYPLATLMQAGIRDILLLSTPTDLPAFEKLFGDGSAFGLQISYAEQAKPAGIAEAFLIGEKFLAGQPCALILGDNIFHSTQFDELFATACAKNTGATVFAREVKDPERFGVVSFDAEGRATALAEKPKQPLSNWAVTGVYIYDASVVAKAKSLRPSPRGELEITDLNKLYLEAGALKVECLTSSTTWLDTGTPNSLLEAACFIRDAEAAQNSKIADLEAIALKRGFIQKRKTG